MVEPTAAPRVAATDMSALTIDQLCAYLERREREAREIVDMAKAAKFASGGTRDTAIWEVGLIAMTKRDAYRELLEALESGVLPE